MDRMHRAHMSVKCTEAQVYRSMGCTVQVHTSTECEVHVSVGYTEA